MSAPGRDIAGVQLDPEDVARRVKAARMLAGYSSVKKLAAAINEKGLSGGTIRKYEEARRTPIRTSELYAIAEACGLPLEWFYVDLAEAARSMRPEVARLPPLTGELGRRVQDVPQDPRDRQQEENQQEAGSRRGTGG